jgi:peptide/nickel transport system substrate-binding protein
VNKLGVRARSFLLAAVFLTALFSLSHADGESPADGDWLIRNLGAEPATLNPITATDAAASTIGDYIYESLLKRDEKTLGLVPVLADSWDISEDHLTYTFHLKRNISWQDGQPFTSRDVRHSFDRIMDPKVDAAHLRNYYQDIEKFEVLDDYTVRFHYRMPFFLALEFCGGIPIVPSHLFQETDDFNEHPIGRHPIGMGPYQFLKWSTGEEIVLVRNEKYWGVKPHLKRIVFKVISDSTVALQVLKQGALDLMSLRPIQWMKQTQNKRFQEDYQKLKYYQPSYNYIGWNLIKPVFSDRLVRRAMTMLVPRETILEKVFFGLGKVISGPFYINSPDYNHNIKPLSYDPAAAVALLKSAGWVDHDGDWILDKDGVPFVFEFLISAGSKPAEIVATVLQENLREVGIRMGIRKLEWAVFVERIRSHDFDSCFLGWSLGWESDQYQVWHSSQAENKGSNFISFKNEEADRIIVEARREFDPERRHKLYHRFHEIIHEEQPYTFLFTLEALVAVSRRFQNVNVYPMGLAPREWWVPKDLQKYHDP